jgi:flavin reductase (DIM6/NTAB) family NADH-FMN oxidoreductase RutF
MAAVLLQVSKVDIPHPVWQPGDKQPVPYDGGYVSIDPSQQGASGTYPLVISTVVPRPIGFLSTKSVDGKLNLSPYSYFGAMGHDPPLVCAAPLHFTARARVYARAVLHWIAVTCSGVVCDPRAAALSAALAARASCTHGAAHAGLQVMVSCNRRPDGTRKDSCANILATGEFVVNIMSAWFLEAANHTCGPYDPGVDEFTVSGLTPLDSEVVSAPRVAESAVHMECKLAQHWDHKNAAVRADNCVLAAAVQPVLCWCWLLQSALHDAAQALLCALHGCVQPSEPPNMASKLS